jgi:hypothetical protein
MKKHLLLALLFCFGMSTIIYAQTPVLNWQTTVGGKGYEFFNAVKKTTDGGCIAAGASTSNDGDLNTRGSGDVEGGLVTKFSSTGAKEWVKVYETSVSGGGRFQSIVQTSDGGYIMTGYANSVDGHALSYYTDGSADVWVVKINSSGVVQWDKRFGGPGDDIGSSIIQSSDGSYIIAGKAGANGRDVSGGHGNGDSWLIKISSTGTLNWQKCFGGSGSELFSSINQTTDGGYILGGSTHSNNGDVSGFHGLRDYWLVKTDAAGNLSWQKCYGGSTSSSELAGLTQTSDGGYFLAGTIAPKTGETGAGEDIAVAKGGADIWALKVTSAGVITWQKTLGGTQDDVAMGAINTQDGGLMLAGYSRSANGDVAFPHGTTDPDAWAVKLSASGVKEWQIPLGGSLGDYGHAVAQLDSQSYLIAGWTLSTDGQVTNQHGAYDAWLTNISNTGPPPQVSTDATLRTIVPSKGILAQVSGTADYNYTVTVEKDVTSTILKLTTTAPNATITINGATTTNYVESKALAGTYSPTVVNLIVTAEDGITTKSY